MPWMSLRLCPRLGQAPRPRTAPFPHLHLETGLGPFNSLNTLMCWDLVSYPLSAISSSPGQGSSIPIDRAQFLEQQKEQEPEQNLETLKPPFGADGAVGKGGTGEAIIEGATWLDRTKCSCHHAGLSFVSLPSFFPGEKVAAARGRCWAKPGWEGGAVDWAVRELWAAVSPRLRAVYWLPLVGSLGTRVPRTGHGCGRPGKRLWAHLRWDPGHPCWVMLAILPSRPQPGASPENFLKMPPKVLRPEKARD